MLRLILSYLTPRGSRSDSQAPKVLKYMSFIKLYPNIIKKIVQLQKVPLKHP